MIYVRPLTVLLEKTIQQTLKDFHADECEYIRLADITLKTLRWLYMVVLEDEIQEEPTPSQRQANSEEDDVTRKHKKLTYILFYTAKL
ncbi:hypothetical protein CWI38_0299p0010 [Hamiltosporidium tvaerminnensis]|uniref:Uncharacterized protein n=1 Tax=Hamiltosporidium tvaerminnensis TaxID=1176355 RepID=A0A4Q9LYQ8_9MICR|nr:hypothetical protein CWI38_0299p0010 [Hamiltosporidium tvaerminnensis]